MLICHIKNSPGQTLFYLLYIIEVSYSLDIVDLSSVLAASGQNPPSVILHLGGSINSLAVKALFDAVVNIFLQFLSVLCSQFKGSGLVGAGTIHTTSFKNK